MGEMMLKKPTILNLNGSIQNGIITLQLFREKKEIPYPELPTVNVVRLKMMQSLTGQIPDSDWELLCENAEVYQKINLKEKENGMYMLSAYSYQVKDGQQITSEEETVTFVLMNTGEPVISPLNTMDFEQHVHNFVDMTPGMQEYFDKIIYDRKNNMPVNGLFLQYEIKGCAPVYHSAELVVERNGKPVPGIHSIVFEDVQEIITSDAVDLLKTNGSDVGRLQKAGEKTGVVFIPIDIRDSDRIRIKMKLSEYADVDFRTKLDEMDMTLGLEDFKSFYYVALASEKPQIIIGDLKGTRPASGDVAVIYNNCNQFYQTLLVKVLQGEEIDMEDEMAYDIVTSRDLHCPFNVPGKYKIVCAVADVRADEYDPNNPEEHIILKKDKEIIVYPPCDIKIEHDKVLEKGKSLDVMISSDLPVKPKRCYISIRKYEPELSLEMNLSEEGRYESEVSFDTADHPNGLHVLLVKYLLSDGTSEVKSSTFLVREDDNFDVTYFS